MEHLYRYFASAGPYGSGAYGSGTYVGSSTTSTGSNVGSGNAGGGATAAASGGSLSNTGFDIIAAITVACVIIFLALIIRYWKRPNKSKGDKTDKS